MASCKWDPASVPVRVRDSTAAKGKASAAAVAPAAETPAARLALFASRAGGGHGEERAGSGLLVYAGGPVRACPFRREDQPLAEEPDELRRKHSCST
jgi:hypothetical protein